MLKKNIHLPGDLAIWIFIFAELLVFAIFFIVYAVAKNQHPELFLLSQKSLDKTSGTLNTITLITSSYFVALSVLAMQENKVKQSVRWLLAAIVCGIGFLVIKSIEYQHIFSQGIGLDSNLFYMFYLSLTAFHFMHVVMGLIILSAVTVKAYNGGYNSQSMVGIETGASYWHMVDLVWIILFPLVYILP